jgi:tRNA A-37 threonylcarbamoyl transferase component Bud32
MKRCPSCSLSNRDDAGFCIRCGFPLAAVTAEATTPPDDNARAGGRPARAGYLAEGTIIDGKYEISRVLGEGGMGIVYLARDVHTDTPVVVKSIRAQFADDPEFRARTLAEGRALARIDHTNVVRLNAVVVEPKALYLVMQFIDGDPLDRIIEQRVESRSPIPIAQALAIFRMILSGVGAAHAEGLIHRDLKPANILVRRKDGVAKVTDFGIAKGEEDAKAGRGVTKGIIGSLSYMAPEQVRGQRDLDKRVDIYALGILLFELLIGRVPFDAPSDYELMRMHAEAPLPSLRALRPDVPPSIDAAVHRACAKDREMRFASTEEFARALDVVSSGTARMDPAAAPAGDARAAAITGGTEIAFEHPPFTDVGAPAVQGPAGVGSFRALPPSTAPGSPATFAPSLPPGPSRQRRRRSPLALWGGAAVGLCATAGAVAYFVLPADRTTTPRTDHPSDRTAAPLPKVDAGSGLAPVRVAVPAPSSPPPSPVGAPTTAPTSPPAPPSSLARLAGTWKSATSRDYTAVLTSPDTLELRISKSSQHPRQNYRDGEVRFRLLSLSESPNQFAVEDHIRPTPPPSVEYDEASRASCVATWTAINDRPLRATYDGGNGLTLDLVQIRTSADKFETQGKRVVSCSDLPSSPATLIVSRLTRP